MPLYWLKRRVSLKNDMISTVETEQPAPAEPALDLRGKPSGNPKKKRAGIGMPATLHLQYFGDLLFHAFGEYAYHVGSSLNGKTWRDVDVRIMLDKGIYATMGFGDPKRPQENDRWCAYVMAFSELGRKVTGLPIDFQIQETDTANADYPHHHRSSLIMCAVRRANDALCRPADSEAGAQKGQSK